VTLPPLKPPALTEARRRKVKSQQQSCVFESPVVVLNFSLDSNDGYSYIPYTYTYGISYLYVDVPIIRWHLMSGNIFTSSELSQQAGISEKVLDEWESVGLVKPSAYSDDNMPLYPTGLLDRVGMIKRLSDMGFDLDKIKKIIRKVGLPNLPSDSTTLLSKDSYLTVGVLADKVGVSTRTIKHWEEMGIIAPDMWSDAGFRLYSDSYIYLCKLVKDLQLFGYSLDEIKEISDYFRDYWDMANGRYKYPREETGKRIQQMLTAIDNLFDKMEQFHEGIERWDKLLRKYRTEIRKLHKENLTRKVAASTTHHRK